MHKAIPLFAAFLFLLAGCNRRSAAHTGTASSKHTERPVAELRVTVRASPEIRDRNGDNFKDFKDLVFPPVEGLPVELLLEPDSPLCKIVSQHGELTYTIWLTKWEYMEGSGNFFWCPEIATIEDQGKIIYDGSVCPVHHTQMQRGELEIHYGLPTQELLSAMRADFSGGPGFILGGCLRGSEKATFGFRCEACIAAYKKWQNDYTKNHEKGEQAAPSEGDKPPK